MYRILVCDADREAAAEVRSSINAEGFLTEWASNGQECVEFMKNQEIHLVILNLGTPREGGIGILSTVRESSNVPVILLSSGAKDEDRIAGLNAGADDCLSKPYNPEELVARVGAQLRRYFLLGGGIYQGGTIQIGGLTLNNEKKSVQVDGRPVSLTPLEFDILSLLMNHPSRIFSPKEIYRSVWNEAPMGAENAVAVHIRHIREKIEANPAEPRYLKVIWGKGYKINNPY